MPSYTAEDLKQRTSEILERAAAGEEVVVATVAGPRLRIVPDKPRAMTEADIEWLRSRRVTPKEPIDSAALIRQMRDEGP